MVSALVLAAGRGSRMHSEKAKQFMDLGGHPLLWYSLQVFQESEADEIVLVTGKEDMAYCETEIVRRNHFTKVRRITAGGKERSDSVRNGIAAADPEADIIMIHDAARPFATPEMIRDSIQAAEVYGACTTAVPVKDTIKEVDGEEFGVRTPDRRFLRQIQTPQTFRGDLLREAYRRMGEETAGITDDTMVVERFMHVPVKMVSGSYRNIKVTTPEDLVLAEAFLQNTLPRAN